jgi:chromosome segregation ATPase
MSSGQQQLERIEEKLASLIAQHQQTLRENQKLRKEQENYLSNQQVLKTRVEELEIKIALLQTSESEGAKSSRAALEKKINTYVKEIDRCIAILGNQS